MYRYPFTPYPNGWYRVAYAHELSIGEVKPIEALGRDLVAFRGEDGRVRVLDAHCPHLGAHLGYGGNVVGNDIACPFHDWRFNGEGECVDIPYCSGRVPKRARVDAWTVCERNGVVFIWWDHQGRQPSFEIPVVAEVDDPKWTKPLEFTWRTRVHIQEVAENALDLAHFGKVHHYLDFPELRSFTTEDHVLQVGLSAGRRVMGVTGRSTMDITYHGLGVVHAQVAGPGIELAVILTTTPVDQEHCDIHIAVMNRKSRIPLKDFALRRYMRWEIGTDFAHDIPIWEHKQYRTRPLLAKGDGPIMKVRKWAEQFYEEAATRDEAATDKTHLPLVG
ncbi:MAG: Rieske 2Fe-2S domain-containing protein [Myxococcota bacterium]